MKAAVTPPESPEQATGAANLYIIREYMQNATPADSFGTGVSIVTTDDIIAELAPMADVSPEEVNTVLISLGYRPGRNTSGSFGWMMRRS